MAEWLLVVNTAIALLNCHRAAFTNSGDLAGKERDEAVAVATGGEVCRIKLSINQKL